MFRLSSHYYDLIYDWKDYASESDKIRSLLPGAKSILDVGCGTGQHHRTLKLSHEITGIDLQPEFIEIARAKNPECTYHLADMRDFELQRSFDAIICLFGSIGHLESLEELSRTLALFARHLKPGGELVLEPWQTPERWQQAREVSTTVSQTRKIDVCRMTHGRTEFNQSLPVSVLDYAYLVGTPSGIEHFRETHRLSLFSIEQLTKAIEAAGFEVVYSEEGLGLMNRGLYLGRLR